MKLRKKDLSYSTTRNLINVLAAGLSLVLLCVAPGLGAELKLDQRPAEPGEWDYHPAAGSVSQVNPPSFSWRPQTGLAWEIQCSNDAEFEKIEYRAGDLEFNVHCPPRTFEPGIYTWRYRGKDKNGTYTNWSTARTFTIAADASAMPLPARQELIARIPKSHPRLFMRPENLGRLRELARGKMKREYGRLVKECERIMTRPPATARHLVGQPDIYHPGVKRCRHSRVHPAAGRAGEVRHRGQANPARMRQVGSQGQHGLPLQRRGRHAL